MDATATAPQRFDIGRVVQRTFGTIRRDPILFFALTTILVVAPVGLYSLYLLSAIGPDRSGAAILAMFKTSRGWQLIGPNIVLSLIGSSMLKASIIHATIADLNGRRATIGECLTSSVRFILPLIGIAVLMWIGIVAGMMLLFVPGIMLAIAWSVVAPAAVVERTGVFGAFSRSRVLTKGHRWAIFGIILVYFIAFLVLQTALKGVTGGVGAIGANQLTGASVVVSLVMQLVAGTVGNVGLASIYYELRSTREGVTPESLASVFD